MKPTIKLATVRTPDGGEMILYQHDHDFSIRINGLELMNSRQHESEQELARLGCSHLLGRKSASVLIGGLGMGYTLRQTLELLAADAQVVVSELLSAVVGWNREYLQDLNGRSLQDERTQIITGDIFQLLMRSANSYDAILLDVDNGPNAMTDSGNQRLYSEVGIQLCRMALRKHGSLAIWSTEKNTDFEQLLSNSGFQVRRYKAKAYQANTSKSLFIWVAADDEKILPAGGEACLSGQREPREKRKTAR